MAQIIDILQDLIDGQNEILAAIADLNSCQYKQELMLDNLNSKLDGAARDLLDLKSYTYEGLDSTIDRFDRMEDGLDRLEAVIDKGDYQH